MTALSRNEPESLPPHNSLLLYSQRHAQAAHLPFCVALTALLTVTDLMGHDCLNVTAPPDVTLLCKSATSGSFVCAKRRRRDIQAHFSLLFCFHCTALLFVVEETQKKSVFWSGFGFGRTHLQCKLSRQILMKQNHACLQLCHQSLNLHIVQNSLYPHFLATICFIFYLVRELLEC